MVNFNEAIEDIRDNNGFKSNNREDSFYRTYKLQNSKPIQVRMSNHGTHLWTWIGRDYDPSRAINICIVFSENGNHDSNVAVDMDIKQKNNQGKTIVVGERQTFEVIQYVYDCQTLELNDVALINATIQNTPQKGMFQDPLANTPKHAKVYRLRPNQAIETVVENKQYKTNINMKQVIRLTESDLHKVISESVKKVLKEIGDTKRGQFKLGRVTRKASNRATDAEARGDIDKAKKYDNIANNANSREADDGRWFQYGLASPFNF